MGKISRSAFVKSEEITQRNAMSHIKLVKHVDTVNKFFMDEITKLQARVTALESVKNIEALSKPST